MARKRRRRVRRMALAPQIRQQLRHRSDEGPSQYRDRNIVQELSEFDDSSARAMARVLGDGYPSERRLSRGYPCKKIRECFAVLRRPDALLWHFSPGRVGIRANLEKSCDRVRIPDDVHFFERIGEMVARQ